MEPQRIRIRGAARNYATVTREQWTRAFALIENLSGEPPSEGLRHFEDSHEDPEVIAKIRETLAGLDPSEAAPVRTGMRLGRYEVGKPLGAGAYGQVYEARDTVLGRAVAMKFLAATTALAQSASHNLLAEAQAASALNHPNIVTVHEVLESDSGPVLVMEFVEGRSLREVLRQPIPAADAHLYAVQLLEGLAAAHAHGIVHRDVKPENVTVRPDGYIKVLDFGLARLVVDAPAGVAQAGTGPAGTLRYMSPEQCLGHAATSASDVFSAGLVLFEMATGGHAFGGDTPLDTAERILNGTPLQKTGSPLVTVALQLLAKAPQARPTAAEALKLLRSADPHAFRRRLTATAVIGALLVLAGSAAAIRFWARHPAAPLVEALNTVNITSQEGYAAGSSFSPDGRQIAFTWDGGSSKQPGVYVQPIAGGTPIRVSAPSGEDLFPVWSPDGTTIAFVRRVPNSGPLSLITVPAAGGPEHHVGQILHDLGYPSPIAWAPGSDAILARDLPPPPYNNVNPIMRVPLDGGPRTFVTHPLPDECDTIPTPSPDGRLLAFIRLREMETSAVCLQPLRVAPNQRASGKCFPSNPVIPSGIAWSADQRHLYIARPKSLSRLDIDSGNEVKISDTTFRFLTGNRQGTQFAYSYSYVDWNIWRYSTAASGPPPEKWIAATGEDAEPEYSPDGRDIVFRSARSGSTELWVCGQNRSNLRQITRFKGRVEGPRWSPDSRQIAFWARAVDDKHARIYTISATGQNLHAVTADLIEARYPMWSADGQSILFMTESDGAWSIPVNGSGPGVKLSADVSWWIDQAYSADRQTIYLTRTYDTPGLWRMPSSGGKAKLVHGTEAIVNYRYWQLLNDVVYYVDIGKSKVVCTFDLKTGQRKRLYPLDAELNVGPRGLAVSPDGKWILITKLDVRVGEIKMIDNLP